MGLCVSTFGYTAAEIARYVGLGNALRMKLEFAEEAFQIHAAEAVLNFQKLSNISDRGLQIEEQQHGHLRSLYWPAENRFLSEFSRATSWDGQAELAARYAGRLWAPLAAQFAKRIKAAETNKPRYAGRAYARTLQDLYAARAAAKANITTLADKIAFAEVQAINDRDFERRKQAIAMRRGLIAEAASLMGMAANGLAAAGADAAAAASSALGFAGNAVGDFLGGIRNPGAFHAGTARIAGGVSSFLGTRSQVGDTTGYEQAETVTDQQAGAWTEGTTDVNALGAQTHDGTHGPFHASNANEAQFQANSGGNSNLARGGAAFLHIWGVPIPFMWTNLSGADLGPVDHYMATTADIMPVLPTTGLPIIGPAANTG